MYLHALDVLGIHIYYMSNLEDDMFGKLDFQFLISQIL